MKLLFRLLLLAVFFFPLEIVNGGEAFSPDFQGLDAMMTKAEKDGFSGIVLVGGKDKILFEKGYGVTALEEGRPIDGKTVFLIGSITKNFTHTGALLLEAEGKLSLDDPISKFLPDIPADKKAITVGELVDHTSGIPDLIKADGSVYPDYFVGYDYIPVTRAEMVAKTLKAKLLFPPGTKEAYSNSGYALLAAIIEIASGEPYERFLKEHIFEPAGMMHTGYVLPDWSGMVMARGIDNGEDWGTPLEGSRWMADGPSWNLRGNGGMLGTAEDLALWVRALASDRIFPKSARDKFLEHMRQSKNWKSRVFASAGSNGIFNSIFVWMPDQARTLVMISNNSEHNAELDYLHPVMPYVFEKREPGEKD